MTPTSATPDFKRHLLFWTGAFFLFMGVLWLLNDTLLPFVVGTCIAYLLNPAASLLQRWRIPRAVSAFFILGLFFIFILILISLALPFLHREMREAAELAPGYIEKLRTLIAPWRIWIQHRLGIDDTEALKNIILTEPALKMGGGVLTHITDGGQALMSFAATTAISPIVAFFMIKDWNRIVSWVDGLLPRDSLETIRDLIRRIDRKMAGFVRGQLSVAAILAFLYGAGLALAGLNFGFLIGLGAGFFTIIPYMGPAFGLATSLIVFFIQGPSLVFFLKIAGVFLAGQFLETYFLTPRLVGKSVGLHPVWIIFAVMAGGALFGLIGMLLAVPVAAIIGVLGEFGLSCYKDSTYYLPSQENGQAAP